MLSMTNNRQFIHTDLIRLAEQDYSSFTITAKELADELDNTSFGDQLRKSFVEYDIPDEARVIAMKGDLWHEEGNHKMDNYVEIIYAYSDFYGEPLTKLLHYKVNYQPFTDGVVYVHSGVTLDTGGLNLLRSL